MGLGSMTAYRGPLNSAAKTLVPKLGRVNQIKRPPSAAFVVPESALRGHSCRPRLGLLMGGGGGSGGFVQNPMMNGE